MELEEVQSKIDALVAVVEAQARSLTASITPGQSLEHYRVLEIAKGSRELRFEAGIKRNRQFPSGRRARVDAEAMATLRMEDKLLATFLLFRGDLGWRIEADQGWLEPLSDGRVSALLQSGLLPTPGEGTV